MPYTRRTFLKTGVAATALATASHPVLAQLGRYHEAVPPIQDPRIKELTQRGLDAARSSGATYADVRLTHTKTRQIHTKDVQDRETLTVGVRALVNGYWGFASGPVWTPDEMARLGQEAVALAQTNALGKPRTAELAPVPVVEDGHWIMPVRIDPFETDPIEIMDCLTGLGLWGDRSIQNAWQTSAVAKLTVQEKAFGATTGSYCTQKCYLTEGTYSTWVRKDGQQYLIFAVGLSPATVGWEMFRDQPLREALKNAVEEFLGDLSLPIKPVDVGRYDAVFDASTVGRMLQGTIGEASELDRALGYEANAGGTSYLNAPDDMLGTFRVGAPLLTVTAERSKPGSAATVNWDDEGVAPEPFTIVQDGILMDYSTTREGAEWLKNYYTKRSGAMRSHGCAQALSAIEPPLTRCANMTMTPGSQALDFDGLIQSIDKGMAFKAMSISSDFQKLNGLGTGGLAFEIKGGKRTALIPGVGILFRAPELWKNLTSLGGAASSVRVGVRTEKGEPPQGSYFSITSVPAAFKDMTVIDIMRKA